MVLWNDIYEEFSLTIVDKSVVDGIIAIASIYKTSEFMVTIICVHHAPENSNYGKDATHFFSHLITCTLVHHSC